MRENVLPDESQVLKRLIETAGLGTEQRTQISHNAAALITKIRNSSDPGLMESFLAEYGLSTDEGIALMCLAEALLRVPDAETIDALIEDKIAPSDWGKHMGHSTSSLVNASTWALMLTGKVLDDEGSGVLGPLRGAIKRLGEPVIRTAVSQAMKEMGRQFVLGRNINEAMKEARTYEAEGFTYSYDMLGEAARTERDAKRYHLSYSEAIGALAKACTSPDIRENPGISVKLSALHPRYEFAQRERVMNELVPRTRSLALLAKSAGMGFNIDAEEADRLDLSLDIIEAVLSDPSLKNWDGFGVVVQAYSPRASHVLDWLYDLATRLDRRIMVRLVKGAYWDTEIKRAQTLGLDGFPVFTRKPSTDVSYISNAAKLLGMTDRIYPQFATHNAHTVAAILSMGEGRKDTFEFQRLHGMGEALHSIVKRESETRCRIYAPVGAHRDLLAYLVRRLLENGANSSFVNQIVDEDIPPQEIAADPFEVVESYIGDAGNPGIRQGPHLYGTTRVNSRGHDFTDPFDMARVDTQRKPFQSTQWTAGPLIAGTPNGGETITIRNPANPQDAVGQVTLASDSDIEKAIASASAWTTHDASERAAILNKVADLYEEHFGEFFAILAREAGKGIPDCINELREAVDFLRYYANEALGLEGCTERGIFTCISPWNFPLAIFTGQISAALAAGNGVLAKPAEATPIIAFRAIELFHKAGVPACVLQLLPGEGARVGSAITGHKKISGVCFTGSTATAQRIHQTMAKTVSPHAPLIAETGGLNAMIVDSTALPEQAVRDIIASSFQSAGQRCSALRVLYLQDDIAEGVLEMLKGAMDELSLGDPWHLATDIGPVIDQAAKTRIDRHVETAREEGRLLHQLRVPQNGTFVAPSLLRVNSIADLGEEIFGPVLHVALFDAENLDKVIDDINATGFGLTFGLHTRIDDRVQHIVDRIRAGNIYVNRNQIGAVVGTQPFGGEGLSGTGPKAGGPDYVRRFTKAIATKHSGTKATGEPVDPKLLAAALAKANANHTAKPLHQTGMPGPTGESNRLGVFGRGVVLCLGPDGDGMNEQAALAVTNGCSAVTLKDIAGSPDAHVDPVLLESLSGFDAVMFWGAEKDARKIRKALAKRDGAIIPMIASMDDIQMLHVERHVCIDTTASGGNTELLAAQA